MSRADAPAERTGTDTTNIRARGGPWARAGRWLSDRREFRYAGLVTLATVAAQALLLVTAPILSRLYTPSDFGHLTLLLTSSTIGGSVASFCYHFVILLPRSPRMAAAAYRLSVYASLFGSALATLVYWAVVPKGSEAFPGMPFAADLALIYLGILTTALFNVLGTVHSRASQYGVVALSKFNLSLFPTLAQIGFGVGAVAPGGLQIGRLVGVTGAVLAMGRGLPPGMTLRALAKPRLAELKIVARRYRDSILHIPRELLMRAGWGLPPALLLATYGPIAAGYYFFAERLIERPGLLLSDALTRIPMKIAAERVQAHQPLMRLFLIYTAMCSTIVGSGIAVIVFVGPRLFGILFGPAWEGAGNYAVIMAISSGVRIGALPIATIIPALRIQGKVLIFDSLFILRVLSIVIVYHAGYSDFVAIGALSILNICYSIVTFAIACRAAYRYDLSISGNDFD